MRSAIPDPIDLSEWDVPHTPGKAVSATPPSCSALYVRRDTRLPGIPMPPPAVKTPAAPAAPAARKRGPLKVTLLFGGACLLAVGGLAVHEFGGLHLHPQAPVEQSPGREAGLAESARTAEPSLSALNLLQAAPLLPQDAAPADAVPLRRPGNDGGVLPPPGGEDVASILGAPRGAHPQSADDIPAGIIPLEPSASDAPDPPQAVPASVAASASQSNVCPVGSSEASVH